MSNKMRDSFTKWYSEQVQCGKAYEDEFWQAWQASRAALVVELQTSSRHQENECDRAANAFKEIVNSVALYLMAPESDTNDHITSHNRNHVPASISSNERN